MIHGRHSCHSTIPGTRPGLSLTGERRMRMGETANAKRSPEKKISIKISVAEISKEPSLGADVWLLSYYRDPSLQAERGWGFRDPAAALVPLEVGVRDHDHVDEEEREQRRAPRRED